MAGDLDLQLTPVSYNPFGFDDQLDAWKQDAQRSIPSPQAAVQPSSGDADQEARDVAAQRLGRGIMGQPQPRPRYIRETKSGCGAQRDRPGGACAGLDGELASATNHPHGFQPRIW
jgi:hypothetical protein